MAQRVRSNMVVSFLYFSRLICLTNIVTEIQIYFQPHH